MNHGSHFSRIGWSEVLSIDLVSKSQWDQIARSLDLNVEEREVCERLLQCKTQEQIATDLAASAENIQKLMEQLHLKLQVGNSLGVVLRIIQVRDRLATA